MIQQAGLSTATDPAQAKQAYAAYTDYLLDQSFTIAIATLLPRVATTARVQGVKFDMALGSLPRPTDLQQTLQSKDRGEAYDEGAFEARVHEAVAESVRKQVEVGIDIVADGELSKSSFTHRQLGWKSFYYSSDQVYLYDA